jgi:hypothetical protein
VIDVSEVINDPDFAQPFSILRSSLQFVPGGVSNTQTQTPARGVIRPAKANELRTLPEGDQISGAIAVHSTDPIYETRNSGGLGQQGFGEGGFGSPDYALSDVILWRNQQYRVAFVWPWADFGYYKAIAVRMSGT